MVNKSEKIKSAYGTKVFANILYHVCKMYDIYLQINMCKAA